jgi:hypothetical protein
MSKHVNRPQRGRCSGDRNVPFTIYAAGTGVCDRPGCGCRATDRPWSYTVGRTRRRRAELVTTGLYDREEIAWITNRVAHDIDVHSFLTRIGVGRPFTVLDFGDAPFRPEPDPGERALLEAYRFRLDIVPSEWFLADPGRMGNWLRRFAANGRRPFPPEILQIVWSDDEGRFPDQPDWAKADGWQQALLAVDPLSYPVPSGDEHGLAS